MIITLASMKTGLEVKFCYIMLFTQTLIKADNLVQPLTIPNHYIVHLKQKKDAYKLSIPVSLSFAGYLNTVSVNRTAVRHSQPTMSSPLRHIDHIQSPAPFTPDLRHREPFREFRTSKDGFLIPPVYCRCTM